MKRILKYVSKYKGTVIIGTMCMLIVIGVDLFLPYLQQVFIDSGLMKGNQNVIVSVLVWIGIITIIKAMLGYGKEFLYDVLSSWVHQDIKNDLFAHIQTLEFEYNKIPYKIYINDIKAVGEGISSYYTLSEKQRSEDLLIVDIGGRTTNVVTFEKGKLTHKFTIPLGTIHLFSRIGTRFNNDEGSNKVVEEIERLIDNGYIKNTEIEEKQFLNDIMNYIEGKVDRRTYKNYYTGGGSLRLKRLIEEYLSPSGIVMNNPLFTNVKGNEIIANMIWGD